MYKRTLALATALWMVSASGALAAPKSAKSKDPALTRADFAASLKTLVDDLEKASKTSWKIETRGAYALADITGENPKRAAILSLVNDYRLWDGAGTITHDRFKPGEAVTRTEAERVLRNLWTLKTKVQPSTTPSPNLAIAGVAGKSKASEKITRSQFAAWAGTTFGLIKDAVRLSRERKEVEAAMARQAAEKVAREKAAAEAARQAAEASRQAEEASAQAREAAKQAEEAREALAEQKARETAQNRAIAQAQQARETEAQARLAEAERATQAEREAQQAKNELAAKEVAEELRLRATELEEIVAKAQAEAAQEADRSRRQRQDLQLARKADRYLGLRPLAVQLSDLPWVSTTVPAAPWLGPTVGFQAANYTDDLFGSYDLFGIGDAKVAMFPGGPASFKVGAGPQGPIFNLGTIAGLQLQPYVGGRVNFGWKGTALDPSGGPAAGVIAHLRAGRIGLYGGAESMLPWTATGVTFQPTSTFTAGAEFALSREVALTAGWGAEYGSTWLPYSGSLTAGVQLGM